MEVRDPVKKRKLSPLAMTGIIAAGVVVVAGILMLVFFVFLRSDSINDTWHDEAKTCEYTFYEDNKMIVDTPYGSYVGSYVIDLKTGKGIVSVNNGSVGFTFEDGKVVLSNGDVLIRGEIDVVHVTTIATETTLPPESSEEETTVVTTEATTVAETTAAETEASSEASTPTPTPTPEATPTLTPTPTPEPSPAIEMTFATFVFETINPSLFIVGTPVVGEWAGPNPDTYSIRFFEDNTYTMYYAGAETDDGTYEYNFFSGEGTLDYNSVVYEFTVVEDELLLHVDGWGDIPYYRV
ncbi:MAG: hypothetical protein JW817_02105 [Clostridiales bacterium]|nr:hypothetical protein [Clostridiales bacterium]